MKRLLTVPTGTIELGRVGTNHRFLLIHDNGGQYPTVQGCSDDLTRLRKKRLQWPTNHRASLSIWDATTLTNTTHTYIDHQGV